MSEEQVVRSYPINGHERCPRCGSEERLGREKILELIEDDILEQGMFEKGPCWQIPLVDPNKTIMLGVLSIEKPKIPFFLVYWDVCGNPDCLHLYVTYIDFIMQEIEIPKAPLRMPDMNSLGLGGMNPPFGRG